MLIDKIGAWPATLEMSRSMLVSMGFTLLGTNISLSKAVLKMSFLFPMWDMLIPWRVLTPAR